jgi:Tol biopolymer transport system component
MLEEETPAVSLDGRYVAYAASQSGHAQIFARDTCQGADASCQPRTILVSSALDGSAPTNDSHSPSMSSDGRYVAFSSAAANLVTESGASTAPGAGRQVYLRDTCFGVSGSCTPSTQLISTDPNGTLLGTEGLLPSLSASGRFVAFLAVTKSQSSPSAAASAATSKFAASSTNSGYRQIFVRDTCLGTANCTPKTTRISLQPGDGSGTGTAKPAGPAISGSADHVALAGGTTATLFTRSVAINDDVFLALTKSQQ